jgi:hypothetical protein
MMLVCCTAAKYCPPSENWHSRQFLIWNSRYLRVRVANDGVAVAHEDEE